MSSLKGKITRALGGGFLKKARVVAAEDVGGFRRLLLRSDGSRARAGTKLQLLLPTDDMRTYSPVPSSEGFMLLGWKRAGGPGARWMSDVKVGDELRFVGPQRSLELGRGPLILVGDETSVAVAAAFSMERPGQVHAVLEARSVDDVRRASEALNHRPFDIIPRGETQSLIGAVLSARAAHPTATIALTGGSELVVNVRAGLRACGVRDLKTKPYWIPGRTGLD